MEKCVLEHCELAWGGQCCFACPKGFYRPNPRKEAADKIDECIAKLRRVKAKLPKDRANGLPRGIVREKGKFISRIQFDGVQKMVCRCDTLEEAMDILADGMDARENGVFEMWLKNLKAERKAAKKAERTRKKGALVSGDQEQGRAGILSERTDAPSTGGTQEVEGTV